MSISSEPIMTSDQMESDEPMESDVKHKVRDLIASVNHAVESRGFRVEPVDSVLEAEARSYRLAGIIREYAVEIYREEVK